MKILAAKIPQDGLDVKFSKDVKWLTEALETKDELKNYLSGNLECNCRLEILKNDVFIKGHASIKLKPTCFRCNGDFKKDYSVNLDLTCIPDKRKKESRGQDYMDGDIGFNYYAGGELDMAKIAKEQMLLALPMTFICSSDCKGLCLNCGKNLNNDNCICCGTSEKSEVHKI